MNRITLKKQKSIALLVAMLMLAAMLTACAKEAPEEIQATQAVSTEVPVTTVPEETTLPEETEVIVTFPEVEAPEAGSITYEEYLELTSEEQQAYFENFETADAFFAWYDSAKAEYDAATEPLETFASADSSTQEGSNESNEDVFFEEESVEDW